MRRKELIKVLKTIAEKAKVAIRNIRRDSLEELKKVCFAHPTLSEALHEVYLERFLHF